MEDFLPREFIMRLAMGAPGFLMAIVFHEAAHAYTAYFFGDQSAKQSGRMTLNPMAHIDVLGTVIFPLIGALTGGIMFGWAKPVPVNPNNFKNFRSGIFWVSFAGPGMNIILGILCAFLLGFFAILAPRDFYLYEPFLLMLRQAVYINFILAAFNLIPFPPLDGSRMVSSFLKYEALRKYEQLANFSFLFFMVLLITGVIGYILQPAVYLSEYLIKLFFYMAHTLTL